MRRRVAVIGASGFVGRYVTSSLLALGVDVVATARDTARLDDLDVAVKRVVVDTSHPANVFDVLGRPDAIIHLAWEGLPNYRSLHHFEQELPRQYAFLRQLVVDGAPHLIVAGTCLEYGMKSGELYETDIPVPANAYALAKHTLHRQLELLQEQISFDLSWCRLFYLYGNGQAKTSLWSGLHSAIERGDEHFNMSLGEQLRDFLPIGEAANYIAKVSCLPKGTGTLNICSGKGKSVRNLVEGWISEAGATITPNLGHYPYPDYEPLAFWGNADKLHRTVGAT